MLKKLKIIQIVLSIVATSATLVIISGGVALAAQPIPAGCPGTKIQGPGTYDCSSIPLGCPGTTQQGPVAQTPTNCPFSADATPSPVNSDNNTVQLDTPSNAKYQCGGGDNAVKTTINFGCKGKGNAVTDLTFAIIRFLSNGVGIIIVGSLIVAGIQYTMSKGDPQAAAHAVERIRNTAIALLLFIFAYALLNFLIPQGFFS